MTAFILIVIFLFSGSLYLMYDEPLGVYYDKEDDQIFLSMDSDEGIYLGDL